MPNKTSNTGYAAFINYFFQELERRIPPNKTIVDVLAHDLAMPKSSVYKRLRGEIPLAVEQLFLLAKMYRISLDNWNFQDTSRVSMDFRSLVHPVKSPIQFLQGIHAHLAQAARLPDLLVHYATTEMAGFQYLVFPELTAFKFHMWNRTTWEIPSYNQLQFSPKLYTEDAELEKARVEYLALWNQTPTCEYWQLHMLENTLSQLRYTAYEGSFEQPETAALICQQIIELIGIWETMADTGLKPPVADATGKSLPQVPFTLFYNEIFHTNNIFLLDSTVLKSVVTTFDNPNTLLITDEAFCNYTTQFFKKIRTRSQQISAVGEKQRRRFFSQLRAKVLVTSKEIEMQLNSNQVEQTAAHLHSN